MRIKFKVPAVRGQGRPRFSKYSGAYKSKKDIEYENLIKDCFLKEAKDFEPIKRPVAIHIEVNYKLPKSTAKYVVDEVTYSDNNYVPQSKPDIDNIAKSVLDALNEVAYIDDKQVYSLTCDKYFDTTSDTDYLIVVICYYDNYYRTIEDIKNERRRNQEIKHIWKA